MGLAMRKAVFGTYRFYPKYSDTWSPYYTCPKTFKNKSIIVEVINATRWVANSVNPDRTLLPASTLFAQVYLSENLG